MSSQLKLRGPALRFAPEEFQAELLAWLNLGDLPDDKLLTAILANDLMQVFALAPHNWALVHATITWMLNFAPPGSYGSAQAVTAWHGCGGLQKERWE